MLSSIFGHSLSVLNDKFLIKSDVLDALEIILVDFF